MQQSQAYQTFLTIHKHRTEQARKNFVEARRELERARDMLNIVDDRIQSLHDAIHATEKYYAAELLPLNQLFTVQLHLSNLHEQLLQEKQQQRDAWTNTSSANSVRDEKMATFLGMQRKDECLKDIALDRIKKSAQALASREEGLATEQWSLAKVLT